MTYQYLTFDLPYSIIMRLVIRLKIYHKNTNFNKRIISRHYKYFFMILVTNIYIFIKTKEIYNFNYEKMIVKNLFFVVAIF